MNLSDWRQSIGANPTSSYRIGNSTVHCPTKLFIIIIVIAFILLSVVYISLPLKADSTPYSITNNVDIGGKKASLLFPYKYSSNYPRANTKYPFTDPVQTEKGLRYNIGIISDLDQNSKSSSGKWISYLRKGYLFVQYSSSNPKDSKVSVEWESGEPQVIKSGLNQDGRGMELSELFAFNQKLYSCDDRTGIIYHLLKTELDEINPIPWVILPDGNGTEPKGFKCEWGCVKDNSLWIGGLGKEWTTSTGELVNFNPQFVKQISTTGEVTHHDWRRYYQKLAHALSIHFPGYVIHESAGWSQVLRKWMFLPRRASTDQYNEKTDEKKGTNIILLADEDFENVEVRRVGEIVPTHGFSSFKWIPGTEDQLVVALKSEEIEGKTASYLIVFDMKGNILLPEMKVGDHKYEGIEFL